MLLYDYLFVSLLAAFFAVFLGRTLVLYAKRQRVFVLGVGKKSLQAFVERAFLPAFLFWTTAALDRSLHLEFGIVPAMLRTPLFEPMWLRGIGLALLSGGLLLFILALAAFGSSWRVGIDDERPGDLVTKGVFSLTRNPIFVALDLFLVGTFLVYSNLFFLVFALGAALGIHHQIVQEERHLLRCYGDSYRQYKRRARRYL